MLAGDYSEFSPGTLVWGRLVSVPPPPSTAELCTGRLQPVVKCCNLVLYEILYSLGLRYSNLSNPSYVRLVIWYYKVGTHFPTVIYFLLQHKK